MSPDSLPFDPVSVLIGLVLGLLIAFVLWKRKAANEPEQLREFNTRVISLNMQLDRAKQELAETNGVVARLLNERTQSRNGGSRTQSEAFEPSYSVGAPDVEEHDTIDDDPLRLTMVSGIGPKLAITLASYGVTDLTRLASISDREMALIESSAPSLADRMTREGWKQQAARLLESPEPENGSDNHANATTAFVQSFDWTRFREAGTSPPANGSGQRH
jgi:predicted flap endonuclease-1-like 5' DNA nuclease